MDELITLAKFIADESMRYNNLAMFSILIDRTVQRGQCGRSNPNGQVIPTRGTTVQGSSKSLL